MSKLRQLPKVHKATIVFGDKGVAKKLFEINRIATILDIQIQVVEAFNGGTDTIEIGIGTDPNYFVTAQAVTSTGFIEPTLAQAGYLEDLGFKGPVVDIYGTFSAVGSATTGKANVIVTYADPFVNP